MGTRSRIGLALGPDQIVSVYCHYDGYIQFTGRKLIDNYLYKEQVEELIDGGDMSIVYTRQTWESGSSLRDENGEYICDEHNNIRYKNDREPQPLYYSERNEDCPPRMSNFKEFLSGDCGEEWCYLFTPGSGWQAWKLGWGDEKTQEYDFVTEEPALLMTV